MYNIWANNIYVYKENMQTKNNLKCIIDNSFESNAFYKSKLLRNYVISDCFT